MGLPHETRLRDPSYWRERAEETRAIADTFQHPEVRQILFGIAENCDRLAEQAERLSKNRQQ